MHDRSHTEQQPVAPPAAPRPARRSLGELIGDLKDDCIDLVKEEAALAKIEFRENTARAKKLSAFAAAGAIFASAGVTVMLIALGIFVGCAFGAEAATLVPLASGLLLVGLAAAGAGGTVAFTTAKNLPEGGLLPTAALNTIKRDFERVKSCLK